MSASEVIASIDLTFKQYWRIRRKLLERLHILCESNPDNRAVVRQFIKELLKIEHKIPSSKLKAFDDTLRHLVINLPTQEQLELIDNFINGKRESLRKVAFEVIGRNFQPNHKQLLHDSFLQVSDKAALNVLVFADADIADIAKTLLQNLTSKHAQARVFEKLFHQDVSQALSLASDYPGPFAWGAARANFKEAVPKIIELIRSGIMEDENPGVMFWALSKLDAKEELFRLVEEYKVDILNFPHLS